jgi:hypothetical protein
LFVCKYRQYTVSDFLVHSDRRRMLMCRLPGLIFSLSSVFSDPDNVKELTSVLVFCEIPTLYASISSRVKDHQHHDPSCWSIPVTVTEAAAPMLSLTSLTFFILRFILIEQHQDSIFRHFSQYSSHFFLRFSFFFY